MALSRKMLKAMGIGEEQIDEIISAHSETVEALKQERDNFKIDADKLPSVTAERDQLQQDIEAGKKDTWKVKYDAMKSEFSDYKETIQKKETNKAKEAAYRALLSELNISEKRHDAITKIANLDSLELDDKGNIKNKETVSNDLKTEWADFIVTDETKTPPPDTPPAHDSKEPDYDEMSDDEFYAEMNKKDKK